MVNAISSLSQFASAQSGAATVAWPVGVGNGDLAVLFDLAGGVGTPLKVLPTGFTEIGGASNSSARILFSLRLCDGTETGNIVGLAGGIIQGKNLHVLRANVPILAATVAGLQIELTGGNPASQTLLASAGKAPLVNFAARGGAGNTFSVESPALATKLTNSSGVNLVSGFRGYMSSPADNTFDAADTGSFDWLTSFYLELFG